MPQLSVAHHIPDPNCKPMSSSSYSNIMPQQRDITNYGINSILSDFQLAELHQTLDTLSNSNHTKTNLLLKARCSCLLLAFKNISIA